MPIYEYLCTSCGYQFEEVQKFSEPSLEECPDCGKSSAQRQVSMSSFHLKGGGWYKDGYSSNVAEKENKERTGKEDNSTSSKESTAGGKPPPTEKLKTTEKKESNSNKIAKTSSKEKAA
tara:strand:+ start:644 stop:1000 length:357 start_codon:yes stop_codon:yes gene_type:complete